MESLWAWILSSNAITGIVTWVATRRKRNNDFLAEMQKSIDLLSQKYNEQLQDNVRLSELAISLKNEIANVRMENRLLLQGQEELKMENISLKEEVNSLRQQLSGIKTITKIK